MIRTLFYAVRRCGVLSAVLISFSAWADWPEPADRDFNDQIQSLITGHNAFTQNKGQLENYFGLSHSSDVLFYTRSFAGVALFTSDGVEYGFQPTEDRTDDFGFLMAFEGNQLDPIVTGEQQIPGVLNYYRGHPSNWVSGIHNYNAVRYHELYRHMDVVYKLQEGKLKYDVIVRPGADLKDLAFSYKGVNRMELDEGGNLHLQTLYGDLVDLKPYSYQVINGKQVEVESRYFLSGYNQIGFELGSLADPSLDVIIDPFTVDWGTHIAAPSETNGTGYAYEYALGEDGGLYGCGIHSDGGFPMVNAWDTQWGGQEATLFKVTADGTALEYSTFIGGNGVEIATACKVNPAGQLYFTGIVWANYGWTESAPGAGDWAWQPFDSEFPVTAANLTGSGEPRFDVEKLDPAVEQDSTDLFFGKLAADGSLIYSTLYGGPGDDRSHDIAIDGAGNGIVVGWTDSQSEFATPNAFQPNYQGGTGDWGGRQNLINTDGFVLSFNPEGNALNYCSYVGGESEDLVRGVAVDDLNNVYICGATMSQNGIAGPVSFNNVGNFSGNQGWADVDGFVAKFAPGMAGQIYGSYIGGTQMEHTEGIEVKCNYEVVLSGYTESNHLSFPIINGIQTQNAGARDGYWMRISPSGASIMNSSFVGTPEPDALKNGNPWNCHAMKRSTDIDVNRRGEIAFIMPVGAGGLPTPNGFMTGPISDQSGIPVSAGLGDAYIQIVDSSLSQVIYGTYLGGSRIEINGTQDHGNDYPVSGIEWHPANDNYWAFGGGTHAALAGTDEGSPLPTTAGSLSPSRILPGVSDQYYAFQFQRCSLEVKLEATDTIICPNEAITFTGSTPCPWSRQDSVIFTVNGSVEFMGGANDTIWTSSTLADGDQVCVIFRKHSSCLELIEADTACVDIIVNPEPRSMMPDTGICPPNTVILDVPSHADSAGILDSYLWSTGATTASIEVNSFDTYFVTLTSDSGCLGYDTVMVGAEGQAHLTPILDSTICEGGSVTITLDAFDNYQWSTGATTSEVTLTASGTYSVTVEMGAECTAQDSFRLSFSTPITPIPFVSDATCYDLCDGDLIVTTTGGTGDVTLSLVSNQGLSVPPNFTDTAFVDLCADQYVLTASDELGCGTEIPIQVNEPDSLRASIDSIHSATCSGYRDGAIYVHALGGTGALTYLWSNGASAQVLTQVAAGNYELIVSDASNCQVHIDTVVTEPLPLSIGVIAPDTVCPRAIEKASIQIEGGTPDYQIQPGLSSLGEYEFWLDQDSSLTFSVTDANGCTTAITHPIDVYAPVQLPNGQPTTLCLDETYETSSHATGGRKPYSYIWDNGTSGANRNFEAAKEGEQTMVVEVKDACNTSDTAIFTFSVLAPPASTIIWDTLVTCEFVELELRPDPVLENGETCSWSVLDGTDTLLFAPTCEPVSLILGDDLVNVTFTVDNGCQASNHATVVTELPVQSIADFTFSPDDPIDPIYPTVDFTNTSENAIAYEWDFSGLETSTRMSPSFTFPSNEEVDYDVTLFAFNEFGCHDTTVQSITVGDVQLVWIPNTFTVDFNGQNDGFAPVVYGELDLYEFLIYDRWGELIWESYTQGEFWDGFVKKTNTYAKQDVYTWKLTVRGSNVLRKPPRLGRVTVIR